LEIFDGKRLEKLRNLTNEYFIKDLNLEHFGKSEIWKRSALMRQRNQTTQRNKVLSDSDSG
jgi:hypothetical protein